MPLPSPSADQQMSRNTKTSHWMEEKIVIYIIDKGLESRIYIALYKKRWQEYTEELYKKDIHDPDNHDGVIDHSPRARHPGMWSQVGLRKHHYKQS